MLNVDVLYLEKNNRSTNIVYSNNKITIEQTIPNILNEACLRSLSTLEGRIKATKQVYKINKFVPVYISDQIIMQPLYSNRSWQQIYINICNVKKISKSNTGTIIMFSNNETLIVDISITRIKQYFKKCLKIKNQFNNYERGLIYYGKNEY